MHELTLWCLFRLCSCIPTNWPFYFGFVAPFVLAYLINWIVYAYTLVVLCAPKFAGTSQQKEVKSRAQNYVTVVMILSIFFAIAWVFALVGTSDVDTIVHEVGQYMFAVFIALHAVFTLIFQFWRLKEAREVWTHLWYIVNCQRDQYAPQKAISPKLQRYRDTELSVRSHETQGVGLKDEAVPLSPAEESEPSTRGVVENKYITGADDDDMTANGKEQEKQDLGGDEEEGEGAVTRL